VRRGAAVFVARILVQVLDDARLPSLQDVAHHRAADEAQHVAFNVSLVHAIPGDRLDLQARPIPALTLAANVGYTHARYNELSPFVTGVTLDSRLPKTPEWKFTFSPQYKVYLGSGGEVVLSADYTHTSSLFNDTENTLLIRRPATDVVNASMTYRAPEAPWELAVGATNLTNERYLINGQAQIAGGLIYGTYSRPAEWYVTARVKF